MISFQYEEDSKRQKITEALKDYPYSFQMKDMKEVKDKALKSLINHLKAGLKAGYSTSLETARTQNLLGNALFRLGEHSEAVEETDKVLKMEDQRNNLVSLANKAYMQSQMDEFKDAEKIIARLKELESDADFEYLLVKAKAELATSYMRFGPRFNQHAVDAFNEVIPQAREPDVWMWKFGLAVTHRHALDLQYAPYASKRQDRVTHEDAMKLLQEVIDCTWNDDRGASNNLKANAHVEMGLLLHSTLNENTKKKLCFEAQTGPLASCKKALVLDDNDSSVLWKAGKLYRNYKDLFKSRKLLEKAVSLQRSTAAYHHLGLTYKAMATNFKYGKLKTRRGGQRAKRRKEAKEKKMRCQRAEGGAAALPEPRAEGGAAALPEPSKNTCTVKPTRAEKQEKDKVERLKKTIKSPKDSTEFDPEDHNVQSAIENLKKSVKFSEGENSRAVYDLALMYKATNNYDDALRYLKEISRRENSKLYTPSGLLEQITALEQTGLIRREMASLEENDEERGQLMKESEEALETALRRAATLYSTTAEVKDLFGKIFHSPSALFKAADASEGSEGDKKKAKARIFSLINNSKRTLALLDDIGQEEQDAESHKLKLQTLARQDAKKAAAYLDTLRLTEMHAKVMKTFESQRDVHTTIPNIYLDAGMETLAQGSCDAVYISSAFRESVTASRSNTASKRPFTACDLDDQSTRTPAGAEAAMDKKPNPTECDDSVFDVMLLHDEDDDEIERKARKLQEILQTSCGLRVVRRDDNCLPGTLELKEIPNNIEQSRVTVVMPGKLDASGNFQFYVTLAAPMVSTVVVLTDGVRLDKLPELNTPHRRKLFCPEELFAPGVSAEGCHTEVVRKAIRRLLTFLMNTDQGVH